MTDIPVDLRALRARLTDQLLAAGEFLEARRAAEQRAVAAAWTAAIWAVAGVARSLAVVEPMARRVWAVGRTIDGLDDEARYGVQALAGVVVTATIALGIALASVVGSAATPATAAATVTSDNPRASGAANNGGIPEAAPASGTQA